LELAQTAYLEAHGTGTVAGDGAELGAVGDAFASSRKVDGKGKLLVGSVKTNIGHLEGCAGLAGIVKAVLAVERGVVPENLNFERASEGNDLEGYGIEVPVGNKVWPVEGVRPASVNCFGFGGRLRMLLWRIMMGKAERRKIWVGRAMTLEQKSSAAMIGV
jgi:acyl transferase domain-containing protein